uniref:Zinc finger FYVE domain-containing protein n=1 Tax=Octopus bimaculoides TaxID=37653 RepID=A0A0L8FND1_OCTBM
MCFIDPVRMCGSCTKITKQENDFFDKHLKVLLNGCEFYVVDDINSEPSDNSTIFFCKLSTDHRVHVRQSANVLREKWGIRGIRCSMRERRLRWFGYVMRMNEDSCVKKCVLLEEDGTC